MIEDNGVEANLAVGWRFDVTARCVRELFYLGFSFPTTSREGVMTPDRSQYSVERPGVFSRMCPLKASYVVPDERESPGVPTIVYHPSLLVPSYLVIL